MFEWLFENPLWLIAIILGIIFIFVSLSKNKTKNNEGTNSGKKSTMDEIGDNDEVVVPSGYYYYQDDNQPVIARTEEQQRIVDEYFIIRNYKTTRCNSEYKKKYKVINLIANIMLSIGLILAAINLISSNFDFELALGKTWFVVGLVVAIGGLITKFIAGHFKKKFDESVETTVAPKKVMTDAEYEALVDEKIESMNIEALGLDKLGLDPDQVREIHPIILRDKVIDREYSLAFRNADDRSIHSSTHHVTYLYFTDEQLFVYKIQFDMCCNVQKEWASEYFYKDICDISSFTSVNVLKTNNFEYEYSTVAFKIIATNSEIGFELDGENENVGSIQAMKQKIREKKAQ